MTSARDQVVRRLRAAFPAAPLDFKGALTGGTDGGEFKNAVDGKPWTELDRSLIGRRGDVLSFLEPKHVAAVMPAFLEALVEQGTTTALPDTLLLVLDAESEPRLAKIAKQLTDDQRAVVAEALEAFAASESGQPADAARHAINSWRAK
jgi:hypothetical protein